MAWTLSLPLDALTQTFVVFGKRGSRKTSFGVRLAEQLYAAELPFVILDPRSGGARRAGA
ncbi:MAG: hypothetical protein Q7W02_16430 [Candidatus Rokubacteria bacterium]|nr:hypothetical protein [Candidatus Rokubacteria bacterium]